MFKKVKSKYCSGFKNLVVKIDAIFKEGIETRAMYVQYVQGI